MDNADFLTLYQHTLDLLAQEEQAGPITNRDALVASIARRHQIEAECNTVQIEASRLFHRLQRLPVLPNQEIMAWASHILAFPNLRFLVIDTTGVDDHADIIRLVVMDREGFAMFDHLVTPERHDFEAANTRYTGIEPIDLEMYSRPLSALWHNFSEAVRGHYVLCFNSEFVQNHLNESASHYGLESILLIGDDLQEQARRFFPGSGYSPKLADVCKRIGHELPIPATAVDRTQGQLAVLRAMSEGNTGSAATRTSWLPEIDLDAGEVPNDEPAF